MNCKIMNVIAYAVVLLMTLSLFMNDAEATYRKPPFNGSIFGKRAPNSEIEVIGKALTSMCELANEVCQTWFVIQEKK